MVGGEQATAKTGPPPSAKDDNFSGVGAGLRAFLRCGCCARREHASGLNPGFVVGLNAQAEAWAYPRATASAKADSTASLRNDKQGGCGMANKKVRDGGRSCGRVNSRFLRFAAE